MVTDRVDAASDGGRAEVPDEGFRGAQVCTLVGHHLPPARLLGPDRTCSAPRSPTPPAAGASAATPTATCSS